MIAKYSKSGKNRVKDLSHKISKKIAEFAKESGFEIVMEGLKFTRRRMRYAKKMKQEDTLITIQKNPNSISNIKPN